MKRLEKMVESMPWAIEERDILFAVDTLSERNVSFSDYENLSRLLGSRYNLIVLNVFKNFFGGRPVFILY